MDETDRTKSHVQSLARALRLLEALANADRELSLTELAETLEWPKSTAHGILATLRDYRFVDQSPLNGRYRLGVRLFEFGQKAARNWGIREIALPVMQKLNSQCGEMVQLATEDAGEVFYLEKIDSTHIIRIVSEIGIRLPMHCSGLGKVLLAYRPYAEARSILMRNGMRRMTNNTITDPVLMESELAQIRKQGFAQDNQEIMEGLRCIAAPIWDKNGEVRYAVSISGLAERLTGNYFDFIKNAVMEAAAEISKNMGYIEPEEE
ncbi:MAG: IclR family transcriptional regulator [Oscillospiraceae bacterium]|nr:IclR family transcriptional regulator [Oscillospiraceae bacterium]